MMIEYAGSYGNDWFVVPLTLPVGSITAVDSLVVTDTFGVRTLLRPIGDAGHCRRPASSMWQHEFIRRPGSDIERPASTTCFSCRRPPGASLEGAALEDVLFMRDEMANLAWAIERSIESPVEQRSHLHCAAAARAGDRAAAGAGRRAALSAGVHGSRQLDPAASGAAAGRRRQGDLTPQARRRAAAGRDAESAPGAKPGAERGAERAAVRRGRTARGRARDARRGMWRAGSTDRRVYGPRFAKRSAAARDRAACASISCGSKADPKPLADPTLARGDGPLSASAAD